jgi:hypothetical protein
MKKMLEIQGKVVNKTRRTIFGPGTITATYNVGGKNYTKTERVQYKREALFLFGIPIFEICSPLIGHVKVGDNIRVHYIDGSPQNAYLPDNVHWDYLLRRY